MQQSSVNGLSCCVACLYKIWNASISSHSFRAWPIKPRHNSKMAAAWILCIFEKLHIVMTHKYTNTQNAVEMNWTMFYAMLLKIEKKVTVFVKWRRGHMISLIKLYNLVTRPLQICGNAPWLAANIWNHLTQFWDMPNGWSVARCPNDYIKRRIYIKLFFQGCQFSFFCLISFFFFQIYSLLSIFSPISWFHIPNQVLFNLYFLFTSCC